MAISLSTSAPEKVIFKVFLFGYIFIKKNNYSFSILVVDERKWFIRTW